VEYDDIGVLDEWTLTIAGTIIAAAKIEDMDDVLRVQTILAFKVDPTPDRWNQVKMLTSKREWEEVKKELVIYLLKASTNPDDKNFVNPNMKVDLLLKEGLWKDCMGIFPKPQGSANEIDLLQRLWFEVEKNSPTELASLLPIVERYVKKYFQEFKYLEMDKFLDHLQKRFPDWIADLFTKGTDMLLVNLLPSQYGLFVQFLRAFKTRVTNLGKGKDWDNFMNNFKIQNKTKKKLMSMVSMISDSSFTVPLKKEKKK